MAAQVDASEIGVGDFDAGRISVGVDLGMNLEAGFGGGSSDQLNDDLVADERLAAPVLGNEREEAVLDLVPLAGAGRQMADGDGEIEFVRELLQFHLPQPQPRSIAAAPVGGDGKMLGIGITGRTHQLPPATDGVDGKARRVVIDANADPTGVLADVVNAIGHSPALIAEKEVGPPPFLGLADWPPFAAGVLEVADQFLLLGIDRDRRLAGSERCFHLLVDVAELAITIRMAPFAGLAVGLQAVAKLAQQAADRVEADAVAKFVQAAGQVAQAFGCPQQWPLRITARRRFDQGTQIVEQARVRFGKRLAPRPRPPHSASRWSIGAIQFGQAAANRAARYSGDPGYGLDAAKPRRARFRRRKPSPPALIKHRPQRRKSQPNRRFVDHDRALHASSHRGNPPLRIPRFKNSCTGPKTGRKGARLPYRAEEDRSGTSELRP